MTMVNHRPTVSLGWRRAIHADTRILVVSWSVSLSGHTQIDIYRSAAESVHVRFVRLRSPPVVRHVSDVYLHFTA